MKYASYTSSFTGAYLTGATTTFRFNASSNLPNQKLNHNTK